MIQGRVVAKSGLLSFLAPAAQKRGANEYKMLTNYFT
jgi:hypothetical protein